MYILITIIIHGGTSRSFSCDFHEVNTMISTWFSIVHVLVAMFILNLKKKLSQIFDIATFGLIKTNKVINVNHVEIILESSWSWFGEGGDGEMNMLLF
jgi:hypothetical protein